MRAHRSVFLHLLVIIMGLNLILPSQLALAASDVVYVRVGRAYLRKGPGTNFTQTSLIKEGTRLDVLTRRGDWLEVKTTLEVEGWILSKATTSTPPPEVVIRELEMKISRLDEANSALEARIRTLADTRQDVELEASKSRSDILTLNAKVQAMEDERSLLWAALGIVVLLLGWGLGFFTGMSRRQLEARHQDAMVKASGQRLV